MISTIDFRALGGTKWSRYPADVLPLWLADMDYPSPAEVGQAIAERAAQNVLTYKFDDSETRAVIVERMADLYDWQVAPEQIVFVPGLVSALFAVARIFAGDSGGVLMQPPIYPPFLYAAGATRGVHAGLVPVREGSRLHYEIDFDAMRLALTPETRVFMLCNPHNPVGRSYHRDELEQLAEIAVEHDLTIVSDEIHCDLLLDPIRHTPIATLAPEVARRTVTLMSPSKTYNIAGMMFGFAIIPDEKLRQTFVQQTMGVVPGPSLLGFTATTAAFRYGGTWLNETRDYLRANRDWLVSYVEDELPGVAITCPEATYLAWLDFNALNLPDNNPYQFLLEQAHVGLQAGTDFGKAGTGFARLNFACARETLVEAMTRIKAAVGEYM
jgi:cystathionine beta-lyase